MESPIPILHEDNHLLVVDKPAGVLSQADSSDAADVLTLLKTFIKQRDQKPGNVFLGLVHRLDRPVSGVMALAKTSKAASRLSRQFRERAVGKIYTAVVAGRPTSPAAELRHWLMKDKQTRITRVVKSGTPGAREAVLRYRIKDTRGNLSLVEIELETGAPHQIRAQFGAIGHPIVGDRKYGSDTQCPGGPGRIALFASQLTLLHPTRREPLTIRSDPPPHWPWTGPRRTRGEGHE